MKLYRFETTWTLLDIVLYSLLWLVFSLLIVPAFFAPYSWTARLLNGTRVLDGEGQLVGTIRVDYALSDQAMHIIKWMLLSVITLGIAYLFYLFGAVRSVINNAYIHKGAF